MRRPRGWRPLPKMPFYVRALCGYGLEAQFHSKDELSFGPGELIKVVGLERYGMYWRGVKLDINLATVGSPGRFLPSYVEQVPLGSGTTVVAMSTFTDDKEGNGASLDTPIVSHSSVLHGLSPKLSFYKGDTIHVHNYSNIGCYHDGIVMEGQIIDPKTNQLVGDRGWFQSELVCIPFEATAVLDSWWGPQAHSELFFSKDQRIRVESVQGGKLWKGTLINKRNKLMGDSGLFPSKLVVSSVLLKRGNGLTSPTMLSAGRAPKGRPSFPYRVTSRHHNGAMFSGALIFSPEHPILVTGRVSHELFKGILLHIDKLEPCGEEGYFPCAAVRDDPW